MAPSSNLLSSSSRFAINCAILPVRNTLLHKAGCDQGDAGCGRRRLEMLVAGTEYEYDGPRALGNHNQDPILVPECKEFLTAGGNEVQSSVVKTHTVYVPMATGTSILFNILMLACLIGVVASARMDPSAFWWKALLGVSVLGGLIMLYPIVVATQAANTFRDIDICFENIGIDNIQAPENGGMANDFVTYTDTFTRTINSITTFLYVVCFFRLLLAGFSLCAMSAGGGGGTAYAQHQDVGGVSVEMGSKGNMAGNGGRPISGDHHAIVSHQPALGAGGMCVRSPSSC